MYQWINMIIMVIQFPKAHYIWLERYFNMQFHSHLQISYVLSFSSIYSTNCKFKEQNLVKDINGSRSMDKHDNYGHPIYKCNTMFCLKVISNCYLHLILLSHMSSIFQLIKVNCKFTVRKIWKSINISVSMD